MVGVDVCVYLSVGWRRKPSGDKGAAPPRAQGALPMPVAAGALEENCIEPLAEMVHRMQIAHHNEQLYCPAGILHGYGLTITHLPECVKEIGDTEE